MIGRDGDGVYLYELDLTKIDPGLTWFENGWVGFQNGGTSTLFFDEAQEGARKLRPLTETPGAGGLADNTGANLFEYELSDVSAAKAWFDNNARALQTETGENGYWYVAMNLIPSATVIYRSTVRSGG